MVETGSVEMSFDVLSFICPCDPKQIRGASESEIAAHKIHGRPELLCRVVAPEEFKGLEMWVKFQSVK